jgi:hypothetical protein
MMRKAPKKVESKPRIVNFATAARVFNIYIFVKIAGRVIA